MKRSLTLAILLCATVPSLAQAPDKPCLQQINMFSFDPVPGNRSLIVVDNRRRRYRVNFQGPCHDLQWHIGLRFKTFGTSNLSCVERGDQVLARDVGGPRFCMIQSVVYQTPDMDKADAMAAAAAKEKRDSH